MSFPPCFKFLGRRARCCLLPAAGAVLLIGRGMANEPGVAEQVKLTAGIVEGIRQPDGIRVFKGIPFAEPPVGSLRWKPPQAVKPWPGVRQAMAFGPSANRRAASR